MKYAVEMGSGAMIYIPSFIKIGSGIQKFMVGGGYTHTHRQHGDRISLLQESKPLSWQRDHVQLLKQRHVSYSNAFHFSERRNNNGVRNMKLSKELEVIISLYF
jgi:hypothetical protein